MAKPGGGTDKSAKHVLDSIGEEVYKEVEKEKVKKDADAEKYKEALKGDLSNAKFENEPKGQQTENDPCKLDYQYHTNVTSGFGREYPCRTGKEHRFSQVHGAECDEKKISGSNDNEGACAPYRRLHLCVRNLENISALDKINKDTLLAEVCLAAKHEGQSITQDYPKYQAQYASSDFTFTMCTMLARSFADIGDIIRGKDLYRGNNGKDKLENNLKKIFAKIHENLGDTTIKSKYNGDTKDYFQLREDWWALNRQDVWKAITCSADTGNKYFRPTCDDNGTLSDANDKCRCPKRSDGKPNDQVPTYFDYVPQYLRWFEEWAEDFCRKRKHKLQNAKEQCRGKDGSGEERYCDFNGYDCKGTASGKHKYRWDNACAGCLFSCSDFRKWIKNEKNDFKRQKEKYNKEINEKDEQNVTEHGTINNIYAKKFYDQLKNSYGTVDTFLNLLNKEKECKNHPEVKRKNSIDFSNINVDETFSHTEICEPCPWCGLKEEAGGKWKRMNNHSACPEEELYTPKEKATSTKINVLTSGEGHEDIAKRLNAFCTKTQNGGGGSGYCGGNSNSSLCEPWQCYEFKDLQKDGKDVGKDDKLKGAGGLCILQKTNGTEKVKKQKTYNDFFNFWVAHVLNDSIDWRKQLTKCLSEDKLKKCEEGCKSNCECFKKWIEKKEKEWIEVKHQFNKQTDIPEEWGHYSVLEKILEDYYFKNIQKAYGDLKSIQEMKKMIEENKQNKNRTKDDEDAIDVLLDHEKEEAEDCLDIHDDEDGDGNTCVEESEKIPNNPCSGTRHRAMVKNVAADMYRAARQQLTSRAGGRKTLRADASKGHYNGKPNESVLKDVCDITNDHSNAIGDSKDPCNGKGDRFKIGKTWEQKHSRDTTNGEFYLPPRRQHICTSNVEHLLPPKGGQFGQVPNDKASDSLLGDVLLAANKQAEDIKKKYQENKDNSVQNGKNAKNGLTDKKTVCRAMKYSFADIGDIIKGTDLWEHKDQTELQGHLKTIFGKIKDNLDDSIKGKYTDQDKILDLRSDWWTANRRQVWRAMKCALKSEKINCGPTPYDDYIPQGLRWMTEWAEWYCKAQNKYYGELESKCSKCKGKSVNCTQITPECNDCKQACEEYKAKIQPWKKQWEQISGKYLMLYLETQIAAANGGTRRYVGAVEPKDKPVVDFLQELQEANKSSASKRSKRSTDGTTTDPTLTSPYFTADRYIHQEIGYAGCNVQTQFCKHKNGDNSNSGKTNEKYAFRTEPYDHDDACDCGSKTPKGPELREPCTIVDGILNGINGTKQVGECYRKESYPDWNCESGSMNNENEGACMPPRRQKLCLYYLTQLVDNEKEDKLREAFIKTAAAETFLSWQYYKSKNGNAETQLNNGTIPPEFLRSMIYTYGDYRDICMDTDISKKEKDIAIAKNKIEKIFPKKGDQKPDEQRKAFWGKYGKDIWEGMLCALEKAGGKKEELTGPDSKYQYNNVKFSGDNTTTLEKFAQTPQFLRWFIEWGDQFCKEHKMEFSTLKEACREYTCGHKSTEEKCTTACSAYKTFIDKWKKQYKIQNKKYTRVKESDPYKTVHEVKISQQGYEYVHKELQKLCINADCNCMDGKSQNTSDGDMPASLDDVPHDYKNKCTCPVTPPPPPPAPAGPPVNVCETVKKALTTPGNLTKACEQKYGPKAPTSWKCISDTTTKSSDSGSICVPPRRRKLYLHKIEGVDTTESLRKWFIESAAIETFFLWHKYKEEKKREEKEKQETGLVASETSADTEQNKLKSGDIPPPFLRQMFYTLGDYRDICVGVKDKDVINALEKSVDNNRSGEKSNNITMKQISSKIDTILKNGDKKPGQTPQNWWNQNAEAIWDGMICALTYKEEKDDTSVSGEKGAKIEQNNDLKNALLDTTGKKPKETKYQYTNVKLEDESGTEAKPTKATAPSENTPPTLDSFIKRPPYFRYLEEWGEEFCRERAKRLKQIYKDCKVGDDKYKCSGDGEQCDRRNTTNGVSADLEGSSCANSCRLYKKWIKKKRTEYDKQEKAYDGQKKKYEEERTGAEGNNGGNEFSKTLKSRPEAKHFLQKLGSCKNNEDGNNKPIFENTEKTFGHETYCDPCSEFKIKCEKANCTVDEKTVKCNGKNKTITAETFVNEGDSIGNVGMLVSDKSGNGFEGGLKEACNGKGIFESITKDEWECVNICNVDICGLKKDNGKKYDQIILMNALVKRWVEYFLEDYKKIKTKLMACEKNGKEYPCIKKCVEQWITRKKEEWQKIKKLFNDQYKSNDSDNPYSVRSFLETLIPQIPVANVQNDVKKVIKLSNFDTPCGCSASAHSTNGKDDAIECMLKKLEDKEKKCKSQASDTDCNTAPTSDTPPELDDEDLLLDETENPVTQPNICPQEEKKEQDEEEKCEQADTPSEKDKTEDERDKDKKDDGEKTSVPSTDSNDQTDRSPPAIPTPAPQPPSQQPRPALDDPAVIPSLVTSTLAWSVGIGFAAFTYFYLKVLYIYINIYGCGCICVFCICMCWYDWIYICVYVCVLYIFYIYVFILKKKYKNKFIKIKKKKKKREKDFKNNKN